VTVGFLDVLKVGGAVLALALVFFLLDRFLLWCESRGWIYWRRRRPSPGTAGSAFLELQAMLEPGKAYVVDEMEQVREEHDDEGDPPDPAASA
jgi:hypothetical protein